MAQTPFSLILLRRLTLAFHNPKPPFSLFCLKPYSTVNSSSDPQSPSSLSARMSFVFDQIEAIERERVEKHESLQRIRAWRQSKDTLQSQQQQQKVDSECISSQNQERVGAQNAKLESSTRDGTRVDIGINLNKSMTNKKEIEVVHPWPEWIELMQRLVQHNYFDHRRKDEDKMVRDVGFNVIDGTANIDDDGGINLKDFKAVHTACLNFGKDRFDILRSLSRQDIQMLVGYGCPSADRKVVFSAKLLRKYSHLDEGDVCSTCSLRSSCDRAFLLTNKEDEARTIDLMRVLLTYGFDFTNGLVVNKSVLKQKSVKTVVRKLLHEVVKLSAVPIDPNLPPPVIRRPPVKVKQPPPPPRKRIGRSDVEMKKGDWLCAKCDFMNFAKNTKCLQCDAKRPKRQLLPGEWECPACNFLNYRRNMSCFHCDCKRPSDTFMDDSMGEMRHDSQRRSEKTSRRPEFSNAWNFDFDDNESDGADVAAFEYADSATMGDKSPLNNQTPRIHASVPNIDRQAVHFNDFGDEDDVDSYELDTKSSPAWKASRSSYPEQEVSDVEDLEGSDDSLHSRSGNHPLSRGKPSKSSTRRASFSDNEDDNLDIDSDEEFSTHRSFKASHISGIRDKNKGTRSRAPSRGLSYGSDGELEADSDVDDDFGKEFGSNQGKRNSWNSSSVNSQRSARLEDDSFSASESDETDLDSWGSKSLRNSRPSGRGANFRDRGDAYDFVRDTYNNKLGDRRNVQNDGFARTSPRSHGKNRVVQVNRAGQRMNDRGDDPLNSNSRRRGRRGQRENLYEYSNKDFDFGEFRNSRRVIER
ncbi:hypothetical protein K2173_019826 [Erythroxylum novogranatense]|uniref:RanBP2-type domain-containing protein n=1 Tax=Erythroxylum novogranatense TaxID=1862640 RepID=A0AAV8SMB4_9ROSI|nr:hypothetical protein K2173_019826 [Erythroxylum novogranatense]